MSDESKELRELRRRYRAELLSAGVVPEAFSLDNVEVDPEIEEQAAALRAAVLAGDMDAVRGIVQERCQGAVLHRSPGEEPDEEEEIPELTDAEQRVRERLRAKNGKQDEVEGDRGRNGDPQ